MTDSVYPDHVAHHLKQHTIIANTISIMSQIRVSECVREDERILMSYIPYQFGIDTLSYANIQLPEILLRID